MKNSTYTVNVTPSKLPEIIANNLYIGNIPQILSPLEEFWQNNISPSVLASKESALLPDNYLTLMGEDEHVEGE